MTARRALVLLDDGQESELPPGDTLEGVGAFYSKQVITATSDGQTTFPVPGGFTPGFVLVFANGVEQLNFDDSDGLNIEFDSPGYDTGDIISTYAYTPFDVADAVPLTVFEAEMAEKVTNPMTVAGDLIVGGPAGVPTKLGIGSEGQVLTSVSGVPAWAPTIFSKEYVSAEQTITAGGLLSLSHGLGVKPKHATLSLKCVLADQGYSAGEETEIGWGPQDGGFSYGANYTATDSVISVRIGAAGRGFIVINKTTGVMTDLTATANWRLVVRAWA